MLWKLIIHCSYAVLCVKDIWITNVPIVYVCVCALVHLWLVLVWFHFFFSFSVHLQFKTKTQDVNKESLQLSWFLTYIKKRWRASFDRTYVLTFYWESVTFSSQPTHYCHIIYCSVPTRSWFSLTRFHPQVFSNLLVNWPDFDSQFVCFFFSHRFCTDCDDFIEKILWNEAEIRLSIGTIPISNDINAEKCKIFEKKNSNKCVVLDGWSIYPLPVVFTNETCKL